MRRWRWSTPQCSTQTEGDHGGNQQSDQYVHSAHRRHHHRALNKSRCDDDKEFQGGRVQRRDQVIGVFCALRCHENIQRDVSRVTKTPSYKEIGATVTQKELALVAHNKGDDRSTMHFQVVFVVELRALTAPLAYQLRQGGVALLWRCVRLEQMTTRRHHTGILGMARV